MLRPHIELQTCWLSGSLDSFLTTIIPVFIVDNHLEFARLVLHLIPTQAITVQSFLRILLDASLALAVDEKLCLGIISITIDRCHLSLALLSPCPVRQEMDGVLFFLPF